MNLRLLLLAFVLIHGICFCAESTPIGNGGKTNWLKHCEDDDACGEGICVSGACVIECRESDDCRELDKEAECGSEIALEAQEDDVCISPGPAKRFCLPSCERDDDCQDVGEDYQCQDGLCRPAQSCYDPCADKVCGDTCFRCAPDDDNCEETEEPKYCDNTGVCQDGPVSCDESLDCEAMDARSSGNLCERLEGYAWDGSDCNSVNCGCVGNDCDSLYPDRVTCLAQYNPCNNSGALAFCTDDSDCAQNQSCLANTCTTDCNSSDACDSNSRCYVEESSSCLLAVVDPSAPNEGGQCLPRCSTDWDCRDFAPGLFCWGQSCVRSLPLCELQCPKIADACPDGCDAIRGRAYYPGYRCTAAEFTVLGCVPEGRASTTDSRCVRSPDGELYAMSGTYAAHMSRYGEYQECSPQEYDYVMESSVVCPEDITANLQSEARFWDAVAICADWVEGYDTIQEMVEGADAVAVGRIVGVVAGNMSSEPNVPENFYAEVYLQVEVEQTLRGTIEDTFVLSLTLPSAADLSDVDQSIVTMQEALPQDPVLFLVQLREDIDNLYGIVNSYGLWARTIDSPLDSPIEACGTDPGFRGQLLGDVSTLDELIAAL
ncbi:MAG: hypothetical protein JXA30_11595 [Deltaproteobacteria bacterium]|nr:hypothetical protein [Deltaproteobacteria bacterium]